MNNAIDITLENTGVVMEVENFDTENNTILVSLSRKGVDADVDSVAPSITVDFGSLPQNVYWDEIQDKPNFHEVATSGDYNDLENTPNLHPVATSGNYNDLSNRPNLKPVATSGDYDDLSDKPQINGVTLQGNKTTANLGLASAAQGALADTAYQKPQDGIPKTDLSSGVQASLNKADTALQEHQSLAGYATQSWVEDQGYITEQQDISGKADKVSSATNGHFAGLNGNGNLTDSGYSASDFATAIQAVPSGGTTGQVLAKASNSDNDVEWVDQTGGGGTQVQSDWNQTDTTAVDYIKNKPSVLRASFSYDSTNEAMVITPASATQYQNENLTIL